MKRYHLLPKKCGANTYKLIVLAEAVDVITEVEEQNLYIKFFSL